MKTNFISMLTGVADRIASAQVVLVLGKHLKTGQRPDPEQQLLIPWLGPTLQLVVNVRVSGGNRRNATALMPSSGDSGKTIEFVASIIEVNGGYFGHLSRIC